MNQPPGERPTARELAARGNMPWACPACGCRDWRVIDSRWKGGDKVRERRCRHCHHPLPTSEVPCPPGFRVVVVPDGDEDDMACA